jgi:hypothetical protein
MGNGHSGKGSGGSESEKWLRESSLQQTLKLSCKERREGDSRVSSHGICKYGDAINQMEKTDAV